MVLSNPLLGTNTNERAISSVGQSASFTPKKSGVRAPHRPHRASLQSFLACSNYERAFLFAVASCNMRVPRVE